MSWDLFAIRMPVGCQDLQDLPDGYNPGPISTRTAIVAAIQEMFPTVTFRDSDSWGNFDAVGASIEINLGDAETCDCIALHIRACDESGVRFITAVLDRFNLKAVDPSSPTGLFDVTDPLSGFRAWRGYKAHVLVVRADGPRFGPRLLRCVWCFLGFTVLLLILGFAALVFG